MKKSFLILLTLVATHLTALAQPGPGNPAALMSASITKLFGTNNAFTSDVDMNMVGADGKSMSMSMSFAVLDTKMRSEIDMSRVKMQEMPQGALDSMKQMGMERIINITRTDLKTIYIVYPGIRSYARMPLPKEASTAPDNGLKIATTPVGKETMDGHPCVKNRVVMTTPDKQSQEFTLWNATDLRYFPIRIQTTDKEGSLLLRYNNIKFVKPDAAQFEPPADFTAYDDLQQMMMSVMQKMMGGMKPPQ